uniref:ESF1, nucleolar pre-rRNA processing protein, homolog (S. cerevisiae) n=1 Tax=Salarias fasciatus TaxID=181472 RepID=A0A672I777_SALFA
MASNKRSAGDERFLRVQKDPRFWEMPDRERKVTIDRRFKSMFHDRRFKTTYTVDKRGRPINHSSTDDLKRFYQVSDSEEEDQEKDKKSKVKQSRAPIHDGKGEVEEEEEDEEQQQFGAGGSSEEEISDDESEDSEPDLARGKGNVETSSDEDDEDEVDDILRKEEEEIEHDWGELCKDAPRSDEVSVRLAVCNMDWDRMKAKDLLVLFNSFCPKGGAVLSVKIYPSQFGKERLKEEETKGPPELKNPDAGQTVYREKMRDYQFKRLKYFYAVLECDSVNTAARIYEECDGYEYESSCSVLDLRFIPDDVTFDEEPRDAASDVNVSLYEPKLFTSSATATSKVQLTWDETDHERVSALNRKFNKDELLDMDFKAYLASSSEEEEEEEEEDDSGRAEGQGEDKEEKKKKKSEEQISRYRELLKDLQNKEKKEDRDMEMEISWVPGLKETTERLVKKKLEVKEQQTPWEEFLQKKKDKQKKKKTDQDDVLSDDELPDDVDLSDPFFSEELRGTGRKKKQKLQQEKEERSAEDEEQLQKQKAEMALLMDDDEDDQHKHFNYDKIVEQQNLSKKKKKKLLKKRGEQEAQEEEDRFQVDVSDSRFQALFTSHLFNLDPSHPSFRKTKSTQSIVAEKQRRRAQQATATKSKATPTPSKATPTPQEAGAQQGSEQEAPTAKKAAMDPSVSLLVKSIKSKTQQFHSRRKFAKKL